MASRIPVLESASPTPLLNVTDVASYVFCRRKAALVSLHVEADAASPSFTLGTTEHEYRRRVMLSMRRNYESLRRPEDVERFRQERLLDCLLWESDHVQEIAKATHPLFADAVADAMKKDVVDRLLNEEDSRLDQLATLLAAGASTSEAIDQLLPRHLEYGLLSLRLRLKGRVDEVWIRSGCVTPVDFKTHPRELRPFFEESHWVQAALYGLILEETHGPVHEVGLRYSHDSEPIYRPLHELRAASLAVLEEVRTQFALGGVPPQERTPSCEVCHYKTRCFGLSRVPSSEVQRRRGLSATGEPGATPQQLAFCRFHLQLSHFLRARSTARTDVEKLCRNLRHALLAELAATGEAKIATRKLLKGLERLVERRMGSGPSSHAAYFDGTRVEAAALTGCFFVVDNQAVVPWVLVDSLADQSAQGVADRCRVAAKRALSLPCHRVVCVNGSAETIVIDFTSFVEPTVPASNEPKKTEPVAPPHTSATAPATGAPSCDSEKPATPRFLGRIQEDKTKPLVFGPRGDRVHGVVFEEHCADVAREDLLVGQREEAQENGKRLFFRVVGMESAPRSAATANRSVDELETRVVLEPIRQQQGDSEPTAVTNGDLTGFKLRHSTSDEVLEFMQLPAKGLPLGELAASRAPVTVRFPFDPEDALFRSFFVVGAKGKGKTSFVRELVTLTTCFQGQPGPRPAVIILDGEPSSRRGASEFNADTLVRAHEALRGSPAGDLLDEPTIREIRVTRTASELAFRYSDIRVEDIPLLLPSLTETSANVLRRVLERMDRGGGFYSFSETLEHLREEILASNQVDGRTARAIAERLMSPQVEILEKSIEGAAPIADLLEAGTITVLNVASLDEDQRKVVALFLLLAIENMAEKEGGINALLVLDEAEKLFPRSRSGHNNQTTIQRVSNRVAGIARRGRRRRFGLVVCTQTPSDVDREIVANCDVKITFCVTGQDAWVRESLGAELVQSVKALPTGTAYVDLRKLGVPMLVRTKLPKTV